MSAVDLLKGGLMLLIWNCNTYDFCFWVLKLLCQKIQSLEVRFTSSYLKKNTGQRDKNSKRNASMLWYVAYTWLQTIIFWRNIAKWSNVTGGSFSRNFVIVVKGGEKLPKGENFAINSKGDIVD